MSPPILPLWSAHRPLAIRPRRHRRRNRFYPRLDALEGRLAPAVFLVKNTNDSGPDSLRQAILDANSQGGGTVTFDPSVAGTINLAAALPDLSTSIDLEGPGPASLTLRSAAFRPFTITSGATVTIAGLTLTNGTDSGGGGAGILMTGAGPVTVSNCVITGNSGAGIYADSSETLDVVNCVIANNAGESGIYITANGSGGMVTVTNTTVSGNSGVYGGGIDLNAGTLTVTSSTISGNTATGRPFFYSAVGGKGGGIYVAQGATAALTNSTIAFNVAVGVYVVAPPGGPGIYVFFYAGSGGGIWNSGTLTVNSSTIAANAASAGETGGGGGILTSGGLPGSATLYDTIVAQNVLWAGGQAAVTGPDVQGLFHSNGHNLIGDTTAAYIYTGPGDQIGTATVPINPLLGPLQNNGGPTATLALNAGSPAIDAGDNTGAPATDQRGHTRIVNGTTDIGAYEYPGPVQCVTALYQDLLHRGPDPDGLAGWTTALQQGWLTRAQVALGIESSPEYRTDQVQAAYQALLGRAADSQGLADGVQFLEMGGTPEQLQAAIMGSPEYYQRAGSTDSGFVTAIYHDVLGRPPTTDETQADLALLAQGVSRTEVATRLLATPEAVVIRAAGFYQTCLDRPADNAGLTSLATSMMLGMSDAAAMAFLFGSPEYYVGV